jgi:hypothetical protein
VLDAEPEKRGGGADATDFARQRFHEFLGAVRAGIGQRLLEQRPHAFVGVQFGRIGRKGFEVQARMALKQFVNGSALVNLSVVEQGDDVSAQVAQYILEEVADHVAVNVRVEQLAVQPQTPALRADGNSGDGRDSVVAAHMTVNRRLAARTPGLAHRGDQQEARFVEEKQMGAQPCGVFFTRGQSARFQCSMASSSRSMARRSGFWWLHPSSWRSLPT